MKCPVDGTALLITERSGVEIDYCPQCRGVWLDRGELDKIIERSTPAEPAPQPVQRAPQQPIPQPYDTYNKHHGSHYKKHKRESFLSDLFDF